MSTKNASFRRKVIYLCAIALLFVPLSLISAPGDADGGGGILSRMRQEQRLSQAQLGKIDPASASMSLATLGMRGVAANMLWNQANEYKKKENWDGFKATLNQIAKLQPNFVSVWQFQAWNISYNVSVEFDDYRHRYHWVKKGVDYLIEGNEYNRDEPLLLWDTGWFFGHKMGRADEHKQFRRLFRDDEDFHKTLPLDFDKPEHLGPDNNPDNWKVAREWFLRGQRAVDRGARLKSLSMGYWQGDRRVIDKKQTPLKGKNPLVFHSDPPKALINYATAIEKEGYLNEIGQLAWRDAERGWTRYGDRPILSSWGIKIRLNERDRYDREESLALQKLSEIVGDDVNERLVKDRLESITDEEREAMETPSVDRTQDQHSLVYKVEQRMKVTPIDLADMAPKEQRKEARVWGRRAMEAAEQVRIIDRYREIVNFVYWKKRCLAEQEDNTVAARKAVLDAEEQFDDGDFEKARVTFEKAWERWATVFDRYPELIDDVEGEIVYESVEKYERLLGQLDESFPPPGFKLMNLLAEYRDDIVIPSVPEESPAEEASDSSEDATDEPTDEEPTHGAAARPDDK